MVATYTRLMDWLYIACIAVCVTSVVMMTGLIFSGVVMRYVFVMGARWAEPCSIFFTVQLTMYGAAAVYRTQGHLRLHVFVDMMPPPVQRAAGLFVELLMASIAVAMIIYGASLTQTTWFQSYPEFEYVRVGLVYSAIPGAGIVTLLFVVEKFLTKRDWHSDDPIEQEALDYVEEERLGLIPTPDRKEL